MVSALGSSRWTLRHGQRITIAHCHRTIGEIGRVSGVGGTGEGLGYGYEEMKAG